MTGKISMNHGSGGEETSNLIKEVFMKHFKNDIGDATKDAVVLYARGKIAFTTDSFVVTPLFFNGGDIGRLAVCGTVNDLLTTGATPKYLSAGFIIEEGCEIATLDSIAASMAKAAKEVGVLIVTGDTKVVGGNGGVFINTSGIGEIQGDEICLSAVSEGDCIIVSGNLGDHHACIMSSRMNVVNDIQSDVAPLCNMVEKLTLSKIPIHTMRDVTRGGLATILNEISENCGLRAVIDERQIPVSQSVKAFCDILGLDPLYMGNEGKMLFVVPRESADDVCEIIRGSDFGADATIVGQFETGEGVVLTTRIGGRRKLFPLVGEALPRIC